VEEGTETQNEQLGTRHEEAYLRGQEGSIRCKGPAYLRLPRPATRVGPVTFCSAQSILVTLTTSLVVICECSTGIGGSSGGCVVLLRVTWMLSFHHQHMPQEMVKVQLLHPVCRHSWAHRQRWDGGRCRSLIQCFCFSAAVDATGVQQREQIRPIR
jgi:hypothetical protein